MAMTEGGSDTSTYVLSLYMYQEAFYSHNFGYAASIATLMFIIIFTIATIYLKFAKFQVFQYFIQPGDSDFL